MLLREYYIALHGSSPCPSAARCVTMVPPLVRCYPLSCGFVDGLVFTDAGITTAALMNALHKAIP